MSIRLALVLALISVGCLFSTDTEGLKCTKTSHCQAGQVCASGACRPSGDGGEGTGSGGTDSTGSSGSSGSGG